jgi:branched-chain amino acid transport system substrate-binding protein
MLLGATNFPAIGYSVSPSSADVAKGAAVSAQIAGLKIGHLNAQLPRGNNVGPVLLAMKSAGVDGFTPEIELSTAFLILQGLGQEGMQVKAPLMSTGYGGSLISAGPATRRPPRARAVRCPASPSS